MSRRITKTIDVDVDETVSADVTLSFHEIKQFFEECTNEEKQELANELGIRTFQTHFGSSLLDQLKMELVLEAVNKFSLEELEQRLK